MGVHSFWDIVGPTAKPVRLESLQERKMAVDASIWIYQFLKAVRDKEGNAIKSAHITGFFRRICKLLYFGIKPVFVFDGGVPVLKRKTIQKRKERREGKRDNATRTAKRILAKQLQTLKENGSVSNDHTNDNGNSSNVFKPFDEWDLPEIPGFKYSRSDERVNSADNFEKLINSIDTDVIDEIDLDSINPASKEFEELPKTTQFMILSTLRLRSRLRMGYTKDQLENIFPDSMDFSKFQIDMLKRRNFFTQKLINVTGINDGGASKLQEAVENDGNRFAGKNSKEYKLMKTENGWTLGFGDFDGSEASKAISLDDSDKTKLESLKQKMLENNGGEVEDEDEDEDEEFEWEDIELKSEPKKKNEDYSLKAARMLTSKSVAGEKQGTIQAFLDTRPNEISPRKMMAQEGLKKPIHILDDNEEAENNDAVIEISSDIESENEYQEQIREIEAMENYNRKRNLEKAFNDESAQHINKAQKTMKQIENNEQPILTEAQQNLRYIVDKIPSIDNSESGSLLFGPQIEVPKIDGIPEAEKLVPEETKKTNDSDDQKQVPEMPSWFENNTPSISYNPYENTNFVDDRVANKESSGDQLTAAENGGFQLLSGPPPEFGFLPNSETQQNNNEELEIVSIKETDPNDKEEDKLSEKSASSESEGEIDVRKPEVFSYDFSEDEEEQLAENMRKEEEDFREFRVTALHNANVSENAFIEDEIYAQQVKDKRDADEVTIDMIREVQELLARFGVPYITAPMEAEAQCAELVNLGLVDGIITDDSDVFLFGGKKVYKNMFHERNYVEYYDSETILHSLGLSRVNMIELAQLLGSDYTTGIKGMGPVSSMEVIAEFGSLEKFRDWYNEGQFDPKKQEAEGKFERDLRKKLVKNEVVLDADFPNAFVADSYLNPEVDHDKTPFVWANPDLDMLRGFLYSYLGWPQEKADEVLIPLIRDINARKKAPKQSTLTDFFPREYLDHKKLNLGKRIATASGKLKQRRTK